MECTIETPLGASPPDHLAIAECTVAERGRCQTIRLGSLTSTRTNRQDQLSSKPSQSITSISVGYTGFAKIGEFL